MRQPSFFNSLRGKIIWEMLVISFLPIILIGAVAYYTTDQSSQNARQSVKERHSELADNVVGINMADMAQTTANTIDQFILERIEQAHKTNPTK